MRCVNGINDGRQCHVVASIKGVEIEVRACLYVGRVDVHEGLVVVGVLPNYGPAVKIGDSDPICKGSDSSQSLNESGSVESCIDSVSSGLLLAADHASIKDSRAVGSIQEEEREAQTYHISFISLAINLSLSLPFADRERGSSDHVHELRVVSDDGFPEGVDGGIDVVDDELLNDPLTQQRDSCPCPPSVGLDIAGVVDAERSDNVTEEASERSFPSGVSQW